MRREERVTVQGPVKEQQPDGMSHRGGWTSSCCVSLGCRILGIVQFSFDVSHPFGKGQDVDCLGTATRPVIRAGHSPLLHQYGALPLQDHRSSTVVPVQRLLLHGRTHSSLNCCACV